MRVVRAPITTVAASAAVVVLTGVALANLPSLDAMRRDHGLVPSTADELARSAVLLVAAVVAVVGPLRARRWAAVTAALHVVTVGLAWAVDAGPVGLAGSIVGRGVAAATLAVAAAASARPAWIGRGRWHPAAALVLAAGLAGLGGVRGTVEPGVVAGALADGIRTSAGLAVTVAAVVAALVAWWTDDRRLAGAQVATAGALAAAAVAGDAARWLGESQRGTATVLGLRGVVAVATVAVGGAMAVRRSPGTPR